MTKDQEYIYDRCMPVPPATCWIWLKSFGSHGYGNSCLGGVTTAHRKSYEAFIGAIPTGMLVQHSCDQRWCVNPDHLSLGTDKSNAEDKRTKGRAAKKLTRADATAIRDEVGTYRSIAKRFGVDQKTVYNIKTGRSWRC